LKILKTKNFQDTQKPVVFDGKQEIAKQLSAT
jgi:hypothetical protein